MEFIGPISLAAPIILAIMGAAMAIWLPESKRGRTLWIAAFIVVGAVAFWTAYVDRRNAEITLRGGDQVPVVTALYGPGMDPKGRFALLITNGGSEPIYDVTVHVVGAMDFSANGPTLTLGTLYPFPSDFMRRLGMDVPLGAYAIHINTKAQPQGFYERFELTQDNGVIRQHWYICRPPNGRVCKKEDRILEGI